MDLYFDHFESPLGMLFAAVDESKALHALALGSNRPLSQVVNQRFYKQVVWNKEPSYLDIVREQLMEYFRGERRQFDLKINPQGPPFHKRVWEHLLTIDYGKITTYGAIAEALNKPGSARAVGAANGANPIAIIVPCHRVIGTGGRLTGYAYGLPVKAKLLDLEGAPIHIESDDDRQGHLFPIE